MKFNPLTRIVYIQRVILFVNKKPLHLALLSKVSQPWSETLFDFDTFATAIQNRRSLCQENVEYTSKFVGEIQTFLEILIEHSRVVEFNLYLQPLFKILSPLERSNIVGKLLHLRKDNRLFEFITDPTEKRFPFLEAVLDLACEYNIDQTRANEAHGSVRGSILWPRRPRHSVFALIEGLRTMRVACEEESIIVQRLAVKLLKFMFDEMELIKIFVRELGNNASTPQSLRWIVQAIDEQQGEQCHFRQYLYRSKSPILADALRANLPGKFDFLCSLFENDEDMLKEFLAQEKPLLTCCKFSFVSITSLFQVLKQLSKFPGLLWTQMKSKYDSIHGFTPLMEVLKNNQVEAAMMLFAHCRTKDDFTVLLRQRTTQNTSAFKFATQKEVRALVEDPECWEKSVEWFSKNWVQEKLSGTRRERE